MLIVAEGELAARLHAGCEWWRERHAEPRVELLDVGDGTPDARPRRGERHFLVNAIGGRRRHGVGRHGNSLLGREGLSVVILSERSESVVILSVRSESKDLHLQL